MKWPHESTGSLAWAIATASCRQLPRESLPARLENRDSSRPTELSSFTIPLPAQGDVAGQKKPLPTGQLSNTQAKVLGQPCVLETNKLSFITRVQQVPLRKKVRLVTLGQATRVWELPAAEPTCRWEQGAPRRYLPQCSSDL